MAAEWATSSVVAASVSASGDKEAQQGFAEVVSFPLKKA